jgi:hypothetical protein
MDEIYKKWMKYDRNGWNVWEMDEIDQKWMKYFRNGWNI